MFMLTHVPKSSLAANIMMIYCHVVIVNSKNSLQGS